jgi:hypothetical protein
MQISVAVIIEMSRLIQFFLLSLKFSEQRSQTRFEMSDANKSGTATVSNLRAGGSKFWPPRTTGLQVVLQPDYYLPRPFRITLLSFARCVGGAMSHTANSAAAYVATAVRTMVT